MSCYHLISTCLHLTSNETLHIKLINTHLVVIFTGFNYILSNVIPKPPCDVNINFCKYTNLYELMHAKNMTVPELPADLISL